MSDRQLDRRRFLLAGTTTGVAGLAGCTDNLDSLRSDDSEGTGEDELLSTAFAADEPEAVVTRYFELLGEIESLTHSSQDRIAFESVETELVAENPETEAFLERTEDHAEIEEIIEQTETALVAATVEADGEMEEIIFGLAREDGGWRLLTERAGQSEAEATGEDSTEQVSDNIQIIGEVGEVDDTGVIDLARLTVTRTPGSSEIDLSELSIQWVGDNGFSEYTHASQPTGSGSAYYLDIITAENETDSVLSDNRDRYEILIPLGDVVAEYGLAGRDPVSGVDAVDPDGDIEPLESGQMADLEITVGTGASRQTGVSVPDTLDPNTTVTL